MLAAAEEYATARKLLGDMPLLAAIQGFLKQNQGITLGMTVPQVYEELLVAKKPDGVSKSCQGQLKAILKLFADSFPGPILHVKSEETDQWLRRTTSSPVTRNNRLRNIRVMFSFAKQRNYLPKSEVTQAELVRKVKVPPKDNEIFTPEQFEKLLREAPSSLIPLLTISGFTGIRAAELSRLDWSAVNLERRHIELRATQAKTACPPDHPDFGQSRRMARAIHRRGRGDLQPGNPQGRDHARQEAVNRLAAKCPPPFLHQLPGGAHRRCRPDRPGIRKLSRDHLPPLPEVVDEEAAKAWFGIMPIQ